VGARALDWLIELIDEYEIERFGDIVGYVYEDLIPAEERHALGEFYTPKPIAELIVKWCVRTPDDKVLDPGCGSGTFLVEAYKRLAELKLKRSFSKVRFVPRDVHEQILSQLVGVDINDFPAHLTAVNLAMRNPKAPSTKLNARAVFYATGTGIIGYGTVEGKFESSEPLWPKEREEGKVIWPYRIKIKVEKVFEKPKPRPKNMLVAFAINKLSEEMFNELLS